MTAHRRLRDLQYGAELTDGELTPVEEGQDADAGLIAEGVELVEDRWRA